MPWFFPVVESPSSFLQRLGGIAQQLIQHSLDPWPPSALPRPTASDRRADTSPQAAVRSRINVLRRQIVRGRQRTPGSPRLLGAWTGLGIERLDAGFLLQHGDYYGPRWQDLANRTCPARCRNRHRVVVVVRREPVSTHGTHDPGDPAGVLGQAVGVLDERLRRHRLLALYPSVGHFVQLGYPLRGRFLCHRLLRQVGLHDRRLVPEQLWGDCDGSGRRDGNGNGDNGRHRPGVRPFELPDQVGCRRVHAATFAKPVRNFPSSGPAATLSPRVWCRAR